jgi:hypothetical protein
MHFTLADQSKGSGLAQDKICIVSSSSGFFEFLRFSFNFEVHLLVI